MHAGTDFGECLQSAVVKVGSIKQLARVVKAVRK